MTHPAAVWLNNLNALVGGLFLLATFGMVAARQVHNCLRMFVWQSVCLATSAFLLSRLWHSGETLTVGVLDLLTKAMLLPWLLRRTVKAEISTRREISLTLSVPSALLLALGLTIAAYLFCVPLLPSGTEPSIGLNLSIGLAAMLVGGLTVTVRREAVPLFLGLVAMENGAFFAGIAIAPGLPLIAEVAIAFDVLILVFVVGLLTRAVQEQIGTTRVGALTSLSEVTKS